MYFTLSKKQNGHLPCLMADVSGCAPKRFSNIFGLSYTQHWVLLYKNFNAHSRTCLPRFCIFRKYL